MNAYCPPAPCPPAGPQPPFPPYPPFPANPKPGDRFGSWVWNGSQWVVSQVSGTTINIQVFTASGVYQPSPGLTMAMVDCVGGGGAGGAVSGLTAPVAGVGGGGGSGSYSRAAIPAALVMGGAAVTIGAGGVPQGPPTGGDGSATSFGAFCIANGGKGGGAANLSQWGGGGDGGAIGTGNPAFQGSIGSAGYLVDVPGGGFGMEGGGGADSFFQGGGRGGGNAGMMVPGRAGAPNSGGGGGGGWSNYVAQGATVTLGGAGADGICIVTEYINLPVPNSGSGTTQPGTCCPCCGQPVSSCGCQPMTGMAPVPIDAMAVAAPMGWRR